MEYKFTRHIRYRYCQKFLGIERKNIIEYLKDNVDNVNSLIKKDLYSSQVQKFIHNRGYIDYLKIRYGNQDFVFLAKDDKLFIGVKNGKFISIITCYSKKQLLEKLKKYDEMSTKEGKNKAYKEKQEEYKRKVASKGG